MLKFFEVREKGIKKDIANHQRIIRIYKEYTPRGTFARQCETGAKIQLEELRFIKNFYLKSKEE